MKYRCQTPVLLLFFNRPQHARAVLDRVRLVQPTRVYVHCDGARPAVAGEAEKVEAVRAVLEEIDWECTVHTLLRPENKGLRHGVSDALNWFFAQEEMGIVLEDDCLPDVSFFPFCETLLLQYANTPDIMHIAGFNPAEAYTAHNIGSYFFSSFAFVWGWASWRRAWQKMSLTLEGLEQFEAQKRIRAFLPHTLPQQYLLDKFDATHQNRNNSWAYAWHYSILAAGGMSIVPGKNLVQNTGIGSADATHTNKKDPVAAIRASAVSFPLIHPNSVKRDLNLDQQLFYLSQKSRSRLVLWYFLKKLGLR